MKRHNLAAAAGVMFVTAMFSPAEAVVVGTANSSSSIPFGSTGGGYFYQQVYNSSAFSSPININEITFYNSVAPGGAPMTGTFDIYLSTTMAQIPNFDTGAFAFPDNSFLNVFHGSLPALSNGRLDFNSLISSFLYNPTVGNLVLTVKSFDAAAVGTDSSKWLYLDAVSNVGLTNARFSAFAYDLNQGLVTGFNDTPPAQLPLPAALPLFAAGLGALGLLSWRRKKIDDAAA